jgi:hypothetical protein
MPAADTNEAASTMTPPAPEPPAADPGMPAAPTAPPQSEALNSILSSLQDNMKNDASAPKQS